MKNSSPNGKIASFLKHLSVEKRLAKNTGISYERDLQSLEKFITEQKNKTIETATGADVQDLSLPISKRACRRELSREERRQ